MTWGEASQRKERVAGVFLLAVTLINAASVIQLYPFLRNGYQDFTAFYTGAKMVRGGQGARLYDLAAQYDLQKQFTPDVPIRQAALPYNHPPFEALLFIPFTYLSYWPAYLLWTFLNVGMVAWSLRIVRKTFPEVGRLSPVFVALAATGLVPVVIGCIQGQDSILLLLLFSVGLASLEENHDVAAGAALGAGLFKFHLVIPLALVLAVRRPRLLLGLSPVAIGLAAISAMTVGWRGVADYVSFLLRLEKSGAGGAISATGMPNLRGLMAELLGAKGGSRAAMLLTIALSIAVLGAGVWQVRRRDVSMRFIFTIAAVTTMLVSYHAITHDMSLLLPIVLLLFAAPPRRPRDTQRDTILLLTVYTTFLAAMSWPWLSPLWCVPVLIWVFEKFKGSETDKTVA